MSKVNYYNLSTKERETYLNEFFDAVAALKTGKDVDNFFRDLFTLSEIVMISRRLQVAKMLLAGNTNEEIIEKLKVGRTTITLVDKWLCSGFGGYRQAIKTAKRKNQPIDYKDDFGISFNALKNKFPAHFWLIDKLFS